LDRLDNFLGGDYVGRSASTQMETLYRSRFLYGNAELRDVTPETVFQLVQSIIEYRHVLAAKFLQPTLTTQDIVLAARPVPLEEAREIQNRQRPPWWERRKKRTLNKWRKLRNGAERIYARFKWKDG
jgi:hypothetical protein